MKKTIRIIFFSFVFLAGVLMLSRYFLFKRRIPEQAVCIPKNSFAVLSVNIKSLALNLELNSGENKKQTFLEKEFIPISKAIEQNQGSGLNETSDILAFMFQDGDAAYIGVTFSVRDSLRLGKLVREQLSKEFSLHAIQNKGKEFFRYDTTSAILGWNENCLLLLFPFSNNSSENTADECMTLLSQKKEASVLSDENFAAAQLNSFDALCWLHADPLLGFTNGGSLLKTQLDNVDYASFNINFNDGEIHIRKIVTAKSQSKLNSNDQPLLISCDPKKIKGFEKVFLDLENKNLIHSYHDLSPLADLPFNEEQVDSLLPFFSGNCSVLYHDTMNYIANYEITDMNGESQKINKRTHITAMSYCFGLKDESNAKKLFSEIASRNGIQPSGNHWTFSDAGLKTNFFIEDHILTMTTFPGTDGKKREPSDEWQNINTYFSIPDYLSDAGNADLFFFFPQLSNSENLIRKNFNDLTISKPLITGKTSATEISVKMNDKKTNSFIQLQNFFEGALNGNE